MNAVTDKQEVKTAKASLQNGFSFHFRALTDTNICSTTRGRPRAARRASRQLVVTEFYLTNTFLKPQGYLSKTELLNTTFSHIPPKMQALAFSRTFLWVVVTLISIQFAGLMLKWCCFSVPQGSNKRIHGLGAKKPIRLTPDTSSQLKQTDG